MGSVILHYVPRPPPEKTYNPPLNPVQTDKVARKHALNLICPYLFITCSMKIHLEMLQRAEPEKKLVEEKNIRGFIDFVLYRMRETDVLVVVLT
jgi:hypothetical protein